MLRPCRYKLRDRFEFPVVLDMFRYTADGLAALEGGAAGSAAGAAGPGAGGAGAGGLDGAAAGGVATGTGGEGAGGVGIGGRPRNHYLYELKGIVVHSGTAFAGHYYSFIKERPRLGEDGQVGKDAAVRSGLPCGRHTALGASAPTLYSTPQSAEQPCYTLVGRRDVEGTGYATYRLPRVSHRFPPWMPSALLSHRLALPPSPSLASPC